MKAYKNRNLFGSATALLSCLLLFSCDSEDIFDRSDAGFVGKYSDNICFGVSPDGNAQTRSLASDGGNEYTAEQFVLRSQDSADTLCVRAIVSEGIHSSGGRQAVTRATPVSEVNFYDAFHVLAYWKKDGQLIQEQFYMDENVSDNGSNRWSSTDTYYWPGDGHSLQFYAWAPVDAFTATPQIPTETTLEYTVPSDVSGQNDLVVTTTDELDGNSNTVVPLTFRHICTAVRFETGSQMQAGTISSVTLKGIKKTGTYDMATDTWALTEATDDFTQELNHATTGTETAGSEVTSAAQTFMMLPQTLSDGATVEVVFVDGTTGTERTLSASIAGMEWPQGTTVTYRISITPEYEFNLSDERTLDAHYEIYKTNLVVSGVPSGQSWTISAPDNVTIQAQSDMNSWAQQGYWTDRNINEQGNDNGSARGNSSYTGTGSGEFPITIFVPENIGEDKRSIELSIAVNGSAVQTITIDQYAPSWYGSNIGCERLEGDQQPWGFYWSDDYTLTFDLRSCDENDRESVRQYVEWTKALHTLSNLPFIGWLITAIFGDDIPDLSFVDMEKSNTEWWGGGIADEITINLGSLNTGNIAESTDNGQQNTRDIYNFQGIQLVNEIINRIQNVGGYDSSMMTETGTGVFPTNNAAIACMKLNSWNIATAQDEEILQLSNNSPTPDWYLPASGEITGISDDEYPLSGNYWTSTSVQNSHEDAYKYDAGGTISSERRDTELNVRAVRKK